ncbi:hypothetical protein RRG08_035896 [Elysia crispata]|uniref:Uncharacterized protein n=1 Tax=Elysia crispata TaxID=231223 RepID=A0AAE1DS82_9GAST|nr:hypothetical protein RRG08_035896 [Elysia crispata]
MVNRGDIHTSISVTPGAKQHNRQTRETGQTPIIPRGGRVRHPGPGLSGYQLSRVKALCSIALVPSPSSILTQLTITAHFSGRQCHPKFRLDPYYCSVHSEPQPELFSICTSEPIRLE